MKKYLTNEGKTAIIIVLGAMILSTGFFFAPQHKAEALVQYMMEEAYDGGGGSGGGTGGTTVTTPVNTPPTTTLQPGYGTSGYQTTYPDSTNWPKPGETKTMQYCTNGAIKEYTAQCNGANLELYFPIPASSYQSCTQKCTTKTTTSVCPKTPQGSTAVQQAVSVILANKKYAKAIQTDSSGNTPAAPTCVPVTKSVETCVNDICSTIDVPASKYIAFTEYDSPKCEVACNSTANACGETNTGKLVKGVCNATTPEISVPGYGQQCQTAKNACGQYNIGHKGCDGSCSNQTVPPNPDGYGNKCTAKNSNGDVFEGTIGCNGCSATPVEKACTVSNSCGTASNKGILVNGVCNATAPANPAGTGNKTTSAANHCGMTSTGSIQCDGTDSAVKPAETLCTDACTSAANSCGQTVSGNTIPGPTYVCGATTPANPDVYVKIGNCSDPVCGVRQNLNTTTHRCEDIICSEGTEFNGETKSCDPIICTAGYKLVGNSCQPTVEPKDGVCSAVKDECAVGFIEDRADTSSQDLWTCKGISGSVTVAKDAECAIDKKSPIVTINPPTNTIKQGENTYFSWTATGATGCKLLKDGAFVRNAGFANDSYTSAPLSANTIFEINCVNGGKSSSAAHSVEIIPPPAILDVKVPVFTGSIAFGETENRDLVITNTGGSNLSITDISLTKNPHGAFILNGNLSPFTLAPLASKVFSVTYKPDVKNYSDTIKKSEDNGEVNISSNVGNKTVPLNSSGVYTVSGASILNVGDVAAGLSKVFKYPVRNNTLLPVTACLKFNGQSPFSFEGAKSITHAIGNGVEYVFGITFSPTIGQFPVDYQDTIAVGVIDTKTNLCNTIYTFDIKGKGVKPVTRFEEN